MAICEEEGLEGCHCLSAAKYACYTLEQLPKERTFKSYIGEYSVIVSPWKLNISMQAKMSRLVPFGTAGYAFTDEQLRKAQGAPKYLQAEPIVMMGYQHMYTEMYECLTRHNTTIHMKQVCLFVCLFVHGLQKL